MTALVALTVITALLNLAGLGFVVYSLAGGLDVQAYRQAYWERILEQAEEEMGEAWREYNDYRWLPGGGDG